MNEKQAERQRLVELFQREFEKKYGYVPSMRRTKSGAFLFDKGTKNQVLIKQNCITHYAHFMNR